MEKKALHLMGVNADKINQCENDEKLKEIVNNCGIINADGASVVLAAKYLGVFIPERVAGIDLMEELLILANEKKYSLYFLGAKEDILNDMTKILKGKYSNLDIVGEKNGYFSTDEFKVIKKELIELKPDIVFVGITSPKKEYIIEEIINSGGTSVYMGVGGSFDVLSGHISRAPKIIQKLNLEWMYRVYKEPKRLFKRYFFGNIKFINSVIKEKRKISNG